MEKYCYYCEKEFEEKEKIYIYCKIFECCKICYEKKMKEQLRIKENLLHNPLNVHF